MTKINSVLNHLQREKTITSWEAIQLYKYTRLGDAIYKLKKLGHKIETVLEVNENTKTRFARYYYKGK